MTSHIQAHTKPCPTCAVYQTELDEEARQHERSTQLLQDYITRNAQLIRENDALHRIARRRGIRSWILHLIVSASMGVGTGILVGSML